MRLQAPLVRRATALATLWLIGGCAGVPGVTTRATTTGGDAPSLSRATLRAVADSIVADAKFRNAHWGMLIVDPATGDTLVSHNAGKLFMPASNQKLLTGATALAQLGADYRYTTRFGHTGTITGGVLDGALVVIGRGDPTFSDAMRGDWRNAFREMADSVAAAGIQRVNGAVLRGGNAFPDENYGFGWQIDDLKETYGAQIDELFVNEGFLPARRASACVGPCAPAPCQGDCVAAPDAPIADPATLFLRTFRDALVARGIQVDGTADPVRIVDPQTVQPVFALTSAPLRAILPVMEKPSQNQIAEILFKTLALEKSGIGSADSGRRIVERQLLAWGARPEGFAVRDGSGLSRHDYVSPETITRVLDAMRRHSDFKVFYDALPIAGVDGTIENRMKGTPAQGNVHAKTGTVDKARSLSGYVTTADGRMLLFSFLCNNFSVPNREVERATDALLVRIAGSRLTR